MCYSLVIYTIMVKGNTLVGNKTPVNYTLGLHQQLPLFECDLSSFLFPVYSQLLVSAFGSNIIILAIVKYVQNNED